MRNGGYAFLRAGASKELTQESYEGFCEMIQREHVDCFGISDVFTIPYVAMMLAKTGRYKAIVACALVNEQAAWHQEHLVKSVFEGLTKVSVDTDVLIVPLIFESSARTDSNHRPLDAEALFLKGMEAASTALEVFKVKSSVFALKDVLSRLWPV
ncbi:6,7-dimethyl-8-ribityllumazine synthase [Pseudomonas sp. Teo4]|uniref:6,7-dimethyl-8-ribityllumazine synthase n=1 Tax=Pseudomonas sp. Teo4 TaxID=3064528 RepID=UPI002ACB12C1|nr:6,7-dimethyl-8-ribityllumazine synthase [Pseudomonas sp. Teo4]